MRLVDEILDVKIIFPARVCYVCMCLGYQKAIEN
jgi:hypothetical protein